MTSRRTVAVALCVALALAGCTGGRGDGADAIEGFAFDPELVDGSFWSIHRLEREDPDALREAAMERLGCSAWGGPRRFR